MAEEPSLVLKDGDILSQVIMRRTSSFDRAKRAPAANLPGRGKDYSEVFPLREIFKEDFFEEKYIVYVQG